MFPVGNYFIWTSGNISGTVTFALDPAQAFMMTGALVGQGRRRLRAGLQFDGVTLAGGQVLCGIRDDPSDSNFTDVTRLDITEFISNVDSVTVNCVPRAACTAPREFFTT